MRSFRNHKKNRTPKSKRTRHKSRKMRHKSSRKMRHKSRKMRMRRGGGKWVNKDHPDLANQSTCPICLDEFSDTPNKAIYKASCGHLFHNNCLLEHCDARHGNADCPICRANLGTDCMDVYAFKEKAIDNPEGRPLFDGDEEVLKIYNEQEP